MNETIKWFLLVLKKYSIFDGRARRKEYWNFILVYVICMVLLGFVDILTGTMVFELGVGLLSGLFMMFMLCPMIAVTARRLHDINITGWLQLINLVPLIGFIAMLYFTVQDSQPGTNQYGSNPKEEKV